MMKKRLLTLLTFLILTHLIFAQCGTCTPDMAYANGPLLSEQQMPDAYANSPYFRAVTIHMTGSVNDAATTAQCNCDYVELNKFEFVGTQNLPAGMQVQYNHANNSYYPSAGDSMGCVMFCGTPLVPGFYHITLNALVDVTAYGIPVIGTLSVPGNVQQFYIDLLVLPDTSGGVSSFTYGNSGRISCDSLVMPFQAVLQPACPGLMQYHWNFPDGSTSNLASPGTYTYNTPDTFPVTLTSTFYTYRIKHITVNAITGGYTGDIEELTSVQSPDPYVKINALNFSNRGNGASGWNNMTFSNVNLVLDPTACDDTLVVELWDEDTGPPQGTNPLGSPDDLLNTFYFVPQMGAVTKAGNNSVLTLEFDTVPSSNFTETLHIIIHPHPEIPVLVAATDTACTGDTILISVSNPHNYQFTWLLDTVVLPQTGPGYIATWTGTYHIIATEPSTGCVSVSDTVRVKFMQSPPDTVFFYVLSNGNLVNNNFPQSGFGIQWYKNGLPIPGANTYEITPDGLGYYSCHVWNLAFPQCEMYSSLFLYTALGEVLPGDRFSIIPNPVNDAFRLVRNQSPGLVNICMTDLAGRICISDRLTEAESEKSFDVSSLPAGIYTMRLYGSDSAITTRVVIN